VGASQTSNPVTFGGGKPSAPQSARHLTSVVTVEELSWGDAGLYISTPSPGLGGTAVLAAGTPEQRERFLSRFREGSPKWAAMAITEPGCGSDSAAITTTAVRDGDQWVLNGTKIFVTSGLMAAEKSDGFVVVWATADKSAGRAGIKAFVVNSGTAGMTVTKVEKKLGIRASDTAMIVFEDCRIPLDNLLGSPEVKAARRDSKGLWRRSMPAVRRWLRAPSASPGGAGLRARELRQGGYQDPLRCAAEQIDRRRARLHGHGSQPAGRTAAHLACQLDDGSGDAQQPGSLDGQGEGGLAVTQVTQKAVELLGPLGYSRKHLLEKWMRDAKINDIFEGTQQINLLIIARRILGYSSKELN